MKVIMICVVLLASLLAITAANAGMYSYTANFATPPLTAGYWESWWRVQGWANGEDGWVIDEATGNDYGGMSKAYFDTDGAKRGILMSYGTYGGEPVETGTAYQNLPSGSWTSGNVTASFTHIQYSWWSSDVDLVLKGEDVLGNPVTAAAIKFGNFTGSDKFFAQEAGGTNKTICSTADEIRWYDNSGAFARLSVDFDLGLGTIIAKVTEHDSITEDLTWELDPVSFASWNSAVKITSVGFNVYKAPFPDWSNYSMIYLRDFSINAVPEPMTMAILGLGGLFLRRRK